MKTWITKCRKVHIIIIGIFLVTIGFLPFLLLGGDAPIFYQDQLDGELFTYLFHAKHLFSVSDQIPEIMCGIDKTGLTPPSLLGVLPYLFLPPLAAFLCNYYFVVVVAFTGMFLLLGTLCEEKKSGETIVVTVPIHLFMCGIVALLFAFLPHYTVYGISIAGIPLLFYCLISLKEKSNNLLFLGVFFYGIASSFILVGYAVIGVLGIYFLYLFWKRKVWIQRKRVLAMAGLLLLYIGSNVSLFAQVLGISSGKESHKEELVLYGMDFLTGFKSIFLNDTLHAASLHKYLVVPVLVVVVMGIVRFKKSDIFLKKCYALLWALFALAFGIACFYGLVHWYPVVEWRNQAGGFLKYFQVDRFYWFYPVIWYVLLALLVTILYQEGKKQKKVIFGISILISVCLLGMMSLLVLLRSDFKKNVYQLLYLETSNAITWNDFYGTDVFDEIRDEIGRPQDSYRVASLGLQPAAAIFNGFYTIDGYSNNYSLEYKHKFREIIAAELEKDKSMELLFDQWGNRCYLFTAELRDILVVGKETEREIACPEFDYDAMKEMNCQYIFSAARIKDPETCGLTLEGEFETGNSFYKIWLYRLP